MASNAKQLAWLRRKRDKVRVAQLIKEGKCPHCEVILAEAPNHNCSPKSWKVINSDT